MAHIHSGAGLSDRKRFEVFEEKVDAHLCVESRRSQLELVLAPALANPAVVFGLQMLQLLARHQLLALELLYCRHLGLDRALEHQLKG